MLSSGTERATLDAAGKGLIGKARARPDQARQVLERVRQQGVRSTAAMVKQRLEELGPLGYSAAGVVVEAGEGVRGLEPGARVAIAGGGFASHAELDVVPSLLCARVATGVEAADAAFATLGAIAMNGFRRGDVQVGCDRRGHRARADRPARGPDRARRWMPRDRRRPEAGAARAGPRRRGGGGRCARRSRPGLAGKARPTPSSSARRRKSSDPTRLAASLARDRASVVIVGDVGMDLPRAPFYAKELDLRLARSYGPGRYDPAYELHGLDYPIGHVRWTEQRNMEAFLALIADGKLSPSELVTHRFPFERAEEAFGELTSGEDVIGIVLEYEARAGWLRRRHRLRRATPGATGPPRLGLIGAGLLRHRDDRPGHARRRLRARAGSRRPPG